jgi:hypothetical protein
MSYAPPLPLPVPASMPAVHPSVVSLDLSGLGLLSAEEASSNQQLEFTVRWPLYVYTKPACCTDALGHALSMCLPTSKHQDSLAQRIPC